LEESKLNRILEIAVNIVIILVGLAALTAFTINYVVMPAGPTFSLGLVRGQKFTGSANINLPRSQSAILVALDTNCSSCEESLPLVKSLVSAKVDAQSSVYGIAVFPNSRADVDTFLQRHQLQIDSVTDSDLVALGVSSTPTVVLIDETGIIRDFWIGRMPPHTQEQLIALTTSSRSK
jgi:hypothetical protein